MKRSARFGLLASACALVGASLLATSLSASELDRVLQAENKTLGVSKTPMSAVDDLAFLRRVTVDLIGRIPTDAEIAEYLAWPSDSRREKIVDRWLTSDRFPERWTAFYGDMLRLRSNAEGGALLTAFVKQSIQDGMPHDELCRRLISAGGRSGSVPEVGFILSDNADPMALAGITTQVFMGVRMACAQCHDHPFDVWKRQDFYGLAAYFGKTKRVEREFNKKSLGVYTTEVEQSTVLWPPEGVATEEGRKPMSPTFPISLAETDGPRQHVARLQKLRRAQEEARRQAVVAVKSDEPDTAIDDLLAGADKAVKRRTSGGPTVLQNVVDQAREDVQQIDIKGDQYRPSSLRRELADLVTNPRNRYFAESFCNRVWHELLGRGFVEPVDDFTGENVPNRPETLRYLADEFVANGYDLRQLTRMVVLSETYQRGHASHLPEAERQELEESFSATPLRRMLSESLYDSIVIAGHLTSPKHAEGKNLKTVWRSVQVPKRPTTVEPQSLTPKPLVAATTPAAAPAMPADPQMAARPGSAYDVEKAIELDFNAVLNANKMGVMIEQMAVKSAEELEAERMQEQVVRRQLDYIERFVKDTFDDNPTFASSLRMAAPAPNGHFLQVFGQPDRAELGDFRDYMPSMRQALLMLNGSLTHQASRVGELEPVYALLAADKPQTDEAIRLAYREILTRTPTDSELADARAIVADAKSVLVGMADLRWVLLNANEFRFIP